MGRREHNAATNKLELELSACAEAELPAHRGGQGEPPVIVHADLGHTLGSWLRLAEAEQGGGKVRRDSSGSKGQGRPPGAGVVVSIVSVSACSPIWPPLRA
jgi:hypothetical protein